MKKIEFLKLKDGLIDTERALNILQDNKIYLKEDTFDKDAVIMKNLNDKKIVQISAGYYHSVATDEEGKVYTWGSNGSYQLGNGTTGDSNIPICISDISENMLQQKKIERIQASYCYTILIDSDGKIMIFGTAFND